MPKVTSKDLQVLLIPFGSTISHTEILERLDKWLALVPSIIGTLEAYEEMVKKIFDLDDRACREQCGDDNFCIHGWYTQRDNILNALFKRLDKI